MNSLIILENELLSSTTALISGERAHYVINAHDIKPGIRIAAALLNGRRGKALIKTATPASIELEVDLNREPLDPEKIEIIVAVPRPQTVKKVLQIACSFGVSRIHFVKAQNVVKSYLQSKSLEPQNIQVEIIKGLEQSGDSNAPMVEIHKSFSRFIKTALPKYIEGMRAEPYRVIASTTTDAALGAGPPPQLDQPLILAIGPESGWTDFEIKEFQKCGFTPISLGSRILRVETALTASLAQLIFWRSTAPSESA